MAKILMREIHVPVETQTVTVNPVVLNATVKVEQHETDASEGSVMKSSVLEAELLNPTDTVTKKEVLFQNVILSKSFFNINRSGPVLANGATSPFPDRFKTDLKWYFPEFSLQLPPQNSFNLTCFINGVNAEGNSTYCGEAVFILQKVIPSAISGQIQADASTTYNEIPLDNLSFSFGVALEDHSDLYFPCTFVQNDNNYVLTIKLDHPEGLNRFYKFISNPANKSFCSIQSNATYFGYTQTPSPSNILLYKQAYLAKHSDTFQLKFGGSFNAEKFKNLNAKSSFQGTSGSAQSVTYDYATNDALPFVQKISNINFDCHAFPNNYLIKSPDNSSQIFACVPPFGDGSLSKHEYNLFHLQTGSLDGMGTKAIYINIYNGNYLVIPERYQIALEESDGNTLIPSAYLFTKIDANTIGNSTATFKFNVAPDISGFQLLLLKKIILQNIPTIPNTPVKTVKDIYIEFPSAVHQPELIQFDKDLIPKTEIGMMGAYTYGVEKSNYFRLEFQNVSIGNGNASFIVNLLRSQGGKLIENISFNIDSDSDTFPQSVILLSLENITGSGLHIQQNTSDNLVYLVNKTLFPLSAGSLADDKGDAKSLDPAILINPNQSVATSAISDITELAFTEFDYEYLTDQSYIDKILNEIRTDAGTIIKDDIIVSNNSGLFSFFNIDHIDFLLSISNPDDPDPAHALFTTNVISLATDGVVTYIDFMLPVVYYLSKWSVVYSTVVHFTDNTIQKNDPVLIEDLNSQGKFINLTASNLNLSS